MTVASMIAAGRQFAEDTFIDEGSIVRPGVGAPSIDPVTFVSTPPAATAVWSGRCRVKKPTQVEAEEIFGDTQVSVQRRLINVPYDAPEVRIDDIFRATSSTDPELLRKDLRVVAIVSTSMLMYRQVGAEVVE